jgi:hypothetical protein
MHDQRLRIESSYGSPATEYRINSGKVQVRTLASEDANDVWWTLTPFKLRGHVERNTAVAEWLKHRIGWRRLLLACLAEEDRSTEARSDSCHAA